jgi:hypothetical protein
MNTINFAGETVFADARRRMLTTSAEHGHFEVGGGRFGSTYYSVYR